MSDAAEHAASHWIGEAWQWTFCDPAIAADCATRALDIASRNGDAQSEAFAHFQLAFSKQLQGRADAEALFDAVEQRCRELQVERALWCCGDARAMRLGFGGRLDDAIALGQRNDARPPGQRAPVERGLSLVVLDVNCRAAGRFDQALRYGYRGIALSRPIGNRWHVVPLTNLAADHLSCMNFDDGMPLLDEAYRLAVAAPSPRLVAQMRANQIYAHCGMHREDLAARVIAEWEAEPGGITPPQLQRYDVAIALGYLAAGRVDKAQRYLAPAPLVPPRDVHHDVVRVWVRARLLAALGRWTEALAVCTRYLDSAAAHDHVDTAYNRVQLHEMQRRCSETLGDWAGAHAAAQAAYRASLPLVRQSAEARYLAVQIQHELSLGHADGQNAAVHQRRLAALERGVHRASLGADAPPGSSKGDPNELEARQALARQRLGERADDIVDLGRLDAHQLDIDPHPFSPAALAHDCLDHYRAEAEAKGLVLQAWLDPALPRELVGDSLRLRQVLNKLIANAVEFTRAGTVSLHLQHQGERIGLDATPQCRLRVEVQDSGVGIADAVRPLLFCESLDAASGQPRLGLALCRRLVQLMDGQIGAESLPGPGSRFWFELELAISIAGQAEGQPADRRRRA